MNNSLEYKNDSKKNIVFTLTILISIGIGVRLFFTPFHIPISLDGADYFIYAVAMNKIDVFPEGYLLTNFGWPTFLSMIFYFGQNAQMLELMNIQRIFSEIISVATVIPIFLICRNFVRKEVAILGSSLFIFDPRIIENSILGIPESLFILFAITSIMFIFYNNSRFFIFSFIFGGLAAFVRYEGLIIIAPIVIASVLKYKENQIDFKNIVLGITVFVIIIMLANFIGYENEGKLNIFSHFIGGGNYFSKHIINEEPDIDDVHFGENVQNRFEMFSYNAITGYIKYLGWIMIPTLIIFVIIGLIKIKNPFSSNKLIIFSFFCTLSIPSLYAYARGIEETKYLLILIPLLCILSSYGLQRINKINSYKIIFGIISIIIVTSIIFLDIREQNNSNEFEMYKATKLLYPEATGVNTFYGNKFVKIVELENIWPELLPKNEKGKVIFSIKKFPTQGYEDPEEYIHNNVKNGLSHLIITDNDQFLFDIFSNEEKYPALEKIYDSNAESNTKYKIFKINLEEIE